MRRFLIAAVVVVGFGHTAQAADLPFLRGSLLDAPIAPRALWEGFYVGGQASYGSTVANVSPTINADIQPTYLPRTPTDTNSYNWPGLNAAQANNAGYGGFFGYNSQWDDVVVGLEGNYIHGRYNAVSSQTGISQTSASQLTTTSTAAVRIDDFGSLRLRAGYVAGNFLPYAFVGGGVGNMVVDRSTFVNPGPTSATPLLTTATKSNLVYGYSAGLGVDVMLAAGFFLRAEYEYQRITSKDIDGNVNSARAGIGYKF